MKTIQNHTRREEERGWSKVEISRMALKAGDKRRLKSSFRTENVPSKLLFSFSKGITLKQTYLEQFWMVSFARQKKLKTAIQSIYTPFHICTSKTCHTGKFSYKEIEFFSFLFYEGLTIENIIYVRNYIIFFACWTKRTASKLQK